MHFQEMRDIVATEFGWDRRVATLAVRIAKNIECFNDIAKTPDFRGYPLLSTEEEIYIKQALRGIRQLCKLSAANGREIR